MVLVWILVWKGELFGVGVFGWWWWSFFVGIVSIVVSGDN